MIKIVGLGCGSLECLTIKTVKLLKDSKNIFLKSNENEALGYLAHEGIEFKYCDYGKTAKCIAENLVKEYLNKGELVYVVSGSILEFDDSVGELINICNNEKIEYQMIESVGFIDKIINKLNIDRNLGIKIIDGKNISNEIFDKRIQNIIMNVSSKEIALNIYENLKEYYNNETKVICMKLDDLGKGDVSEVTMGDLLKKEDFDCSTFIYISKENCKKDIYDLVEVIDILRSENGCPWDKEQTHDSIKKALIEESYEVYDAIINEQWDGVVEELGDVLMQVIFHASLGKEEEKFTLTDITDGICNKMIFRHPHVFGDARVDNSEEVLVAWEDLKKKEKKFNTITDELEGIAKSLPALIRAKKIQAKVKKIGFDFEDVDEAIKKIKEELIEVIDVYKSENKARITEEIGDLIFSCVNVSRFLDIDAEEALNITNDKFIKRLNYMEQKISKKRIKMEEISLEDMNKLWNEAKKEEK